MTIREISQYDTVYCTVLYRNAAKGFSSLKIDGMTENPFVIMYDGYLPKDTKIMGTVAKISDDGGYVRVRLDSVLNAGSSAA